MKKGILLLIAAFISLGAMAQKSEIRVGYGVASANRLVNTKHGIFGTDWKQQYSDIKSVNVGAASGAITFGYRYKVSRIRIGLAGAYEKINGKYTFIDSSSTDVTANGKNTYWTLAADLQFSYLKLPKGIVELYWGASAGIAFESQEFKNVKNFINDAKHNRFAYQVVPIGVSVGVPWIGAYAEAGFGYRGVLNIGAYVRF